MITDIQLAPTSELIEELTKRCHYGCVIVCCYKDEDILSKQGKDVVMTNSSGFANNDEIMEIMVKIVNSMIIDYNQRKSS